MSEGEDIEKCLVKAIKTANREIIKEASRDEHLKGMGTTVVVATIMNQMMYFANVGGQPSVSDQSGDPAAYERPFTGGGDGAARRH